MNIRFYYCNQQTSIVMGCGNSSQLLQTKTPANESHLARHKTIDCRKRSTKVMNAINQNIVIVSEKLDEAQIQYCLLHLKEHQLFSNLDEKDLRVLVEQMIYAQSNEHQYLFHQGDIGHCFFLIEKGQVSVEVNQNVVTLLSPGQCFGELALMFRSSRAASIKCLEKRNSFFLMKPQLYKKALLKMKNDEYSQNKQIVERITLFQCLTNKQKYVLTNSFKRISFKAGQTIFNTGDQAQALYIISEGEVEINLPDKTTLTLDKYESFGESALKNNELRKGNAKALCETTCLVIGKKDIQKSINSNSQNLLFYNIEKWALLRHQQFKQFNSNELNRIIMAFENIYFEENSLIPEKYKGLIVSLEGKINNKEGYNLENMDQWLNKSKPKELIKNEEGYIGYLSFSRMNQIIKSIENRKKLFRASQKCIPEGIEEISIDDFQFIKKLGEGQFGQVYLVKNPNLGGHLYALKCLSKAAILEEQMESAVVEEKKILQKAMFPYIVGYVKAFHDKKNIFLLLEYLQGKEMFDVIREMPTLNKSIARYYFGCILLSIEYLHANNIIYRDIKPENSVVDYKGKAFLIDMGTAKQLNEKNMFRTFTIIGTPHYMAPEVFEGKGYSFEYDYWSLGVLLYEFVTGKLPFGENIQDNPYAIYSIIKKTKVKFPDWFKDKKAENLVNFLLIKDPKVRSCEVTFQRIKNHEYFEGFNWEDLLEEKIIPPYVPKGRKKSNEYVQKKGEVNFLRHIYGSKRHGKIKEWDEDRGI